MLAAPLVARPDVLPIDFGVRRLTLAPISGTIAPSFRWSAPQGTLAVQCALFACPPIIEVDQDVGAGVMSIAGRAIVNYDACVLLEGTFSPDAGAVLLEAMRLPKRRTCTSYAPVVAAPPAMTGIAMGCWFYGETAILAATSLAAVDPAAAADLVEGISPNCTGDGRSACPLDGGMGICVGETCTPRCRTHEDCVGKCGAASCKCDFGPHEYVGGCVGE